MPTDVQLGDDGGWLLNETGDDLALIDGIDEQAQSMRTELRTQSGTSIYDPTFGIQYRKQVLVRAPDLATIGSVFRGKILARPDVQSVPRFRIERTAADEITIEFTAVSTDGEATTSTIVV